MAKNNASVYKKVLKLPPAIGDWTKLKNDQLQNGFAAKEYYPKLSSWQLDKLHLLHYQLAVNFQEKLSRIFEQPIQIESVTAEQLKYRVFSEMFTQAVIQANFRTDRGEIIFCLDPALAEMLVDGALGGRGKELNRSLSFTEIEKMVLTEVLQELLAEYDRVFKSFFAAAPTLGELISDGPKNFFMADDDFLFLMTLVINFGDGGRGQIFMGYSDEILKTTLDILGPAGNKATGRNVVLNAQTLEGILVPVASELGMASLTTGELSKIRLGDVVTLDKKAGSPVYLIVGQKVRLKANLGAYQGRLSLQLAREGGKSEPAWASILETEASPNFSETKKTETKESGEEMVSGKYPENDMPEYEPVIEKEKVSEETADFYDENDKAEKPYTEEEEAEDYGFSLDEE